jgi:hypothetical protein
MEKKIDTHDEWIPTSHDGMMKIIMFLNLK